MFDFLMTPEQLQLRDETRDLVKWIPREYILDMDADKIKYPKEFMVEAGRRNLIGIRVPKEYGGRGGQWQDDVIVAEEVCVPGYIFGCAWGVTGDVVTEALVHFGTEEQKKSTCRPSAKGKICGRVSDRTRGGSDFFGATTIARRDGEDFILNGQKRFIVGGEGADYFLVYAKTDPDAPSGKSMTCFMVEREMEVKTEYLYNLMGPAAEAQPGGFRKRQGSERKCDRRNKRSGYCI
jgi:alkylation response protein AidB-like acyl-CoA dehydrogenase